MEYKLDTRTNVLRVCAPAILTSRTIIQYLREILGNNSVTMGQIAVVNLERVNDLIIRHSDLVELESLQAQVVENGRAWSLFIASQQSTRDMLDSMANSFRRSRMEISICHSEHRAEEVLGQIRSSFRQEI